MRNIVMIRRTRTGYSADVPDLPGCVATGMTVEHTRQQLAEAVESHLQAMREADDAVPAPAGRLEFVVHDDKDEEFCTWVEIEPASPVPSLKGTGVATKPTSKRKHR
jgi:predicted RNase H-like HicB family nuclease